MWFSTKKKFNFCEIFILKHLKQIKMVQRVKLYSTMYNYIIRYNIYDYAYHYLQPWYPPAIQP